MKKSLPIVIVAVLIAGGVGFAGGMQYQISKSAAASAAGRAAFTQGGAGGAGFRSGRGGAGGAGANAGVVTGSVLSMDAQSITVKTRDGGSKIVFYSGSTMASKPTDVPVSTVGVGDNVIIQGTPNSDGSVTAQSIQIRPAGTPVPGGAPQGGQQPGAGTGANTNTVTQPTK